MSEKYYCTRPFEFFEVYDDGRVSCCCPSWINNYEIGNIKDKSVEEVWNSEEAQELRRSILDGSYRYCNREVCPHLETKTHCVQTLYQIGNTNSDRGWNLIHDDIIEGKTKLDHTPLDINFGYDRSCNLECPSCRLELIMESGKKREQILNIQDKLKKEAFHNAKSFCITGSGDAFASPVFRDLLRTLKEEDAPNLETIQILTNGLLMKKYWDSLSDYSKEKIKHISISIDAATEETYKVVRKGGDWNMLLENLEFAQHLQATGQISTFNTSFVVQNDNLSEVLQFLDLCKKYDVKCVQFQTYEPDFLIGSADFFETWFYRAVQEKKHPRHQELIDIVFDPELNKHVRAHLAHNSQLMHVNLGGLFNLLNNVDISQLDDNLQKYGYKEVFYDSKLHFIDCNSIQTMYGTDVVITDRLNIIWNGDEWVDFETYDPFNDQKKTKISDIYKDADNSSLPIVDTSALFCEQPFDNFEVDEHGNVRTCCSYWMDESIGNIHESSITEILNSDKAKNIRASILDGSFSYCNKKTCPRLQNVDALPKRQDVTQKRHKHIIENNITDMDSIKHVNFLWDDSCNLKCPSCRISSILHTSGKKYDDAVAIQNKIMNFVLNEQPKGHTSLNITGSGDPFGSKVFRDFLINFDGKQHPEIMINLQTNGVMLTEKMWNMLHKCHENINQVIVSIDAATKETYDKIRVGGDWDLLMKNIEMLSRLRVEGKINILRIDSVVQKNNYKEMSACVELANSLDGVDKMNFSIITDWGTWKREVFEDHAVWMEDNKLHKDFLNVLDNDIFDGSKVDLGNVYHYYKIARGQND